MSFFEDDNRGIVTYLMIAMFRGPLPGFLVWTALVGILDTLDIVDTGDASAPWRWLIFALVVIISSFCATGRVCLYDGGPLVIYFVLMLISVVGGGYVSWRLTSKWTMDRIARH